MKIGLIIHSYTGNTLSVGEKLKSALTAAGHQVILERVTAVDENPNTGLNVQLKDIPAVASFDAIIFGAPVRGFSLSPAMKIYFAQLPRLSGKKVACYVTEQFPKPWMGGKQALKMMIAAIGEKGAEAAETGIINWSSKKREEQISELVARFCRDLT